MCCGMRIHQAILVAVLSVVTVALRSAAFVGATSLDEARAMVKGAYDANQRGDHAEAVRLAGMVVSEKGDLAAYWAGPNAKHPAPEADIQDPVAFVRAQLQAARDTGAELNLEIAGTRARAELLRGYVGIGDWWAAARLAEAIVRENPRADLTWGNLWVARKHLAAGNPSFPWVLVLSAPGGRILCSRRPVVESDVVWTEVRALAEMPDSRVQWDAGRRCATVAVGGRSFSFRPDSVEVGVDGKTIMAPQAPRMQDGRTWVSVEALTAAGFWSQSYPEARMVIVGIGPGAATIQGGGAGIEER
jgi:hypothetical protein